MTAAVFADDPTEPCIEPDVVKHLDHLAALAEAGNVEELSKHGRVYWSKSAWRHHSIVKHGSLESIPNIPRLSSLRQTCQLRCDLIHQTLHHGGSELELQLSRFEQFR